MATAQDAQAEQLNPQIRAAIPSRYKTIVDAKDWKNPYLVIRSEDIEVIASGVASRRKTVSVADLQHTLVNLPVTSWPYGRVVAIQDVGIMAPSGSDNLIARNRIATLAILKRLGVTVERFPS